MSEGLLKKRIRPIINTGIYSEIEDQEAEIAKIVDEAKKELMPIIYEWFGVLITEYSGTSDEDELRKEYQQFKKWFGDSS